MEEQKLEMEEQKRRGVRLVLVPLPLQGHINPMFQLASILYSKGFSITIIHTSFNSPNSSKYPNFTFLPIHDGISGDVAQTSLPEVLVLLSQLNTNCVVPFRDCLLRLLSSGGDDDQEGEPKIPCIISDAMMYFTKDVADDLKLPRIALRTSSVESFLSFAAIQVSRQMSQFYVSDSQQEKSITDTSSSTVKDGKTHDLDREENLYQLLTNMVDRVKASSGLVWNTFDHLEPVAIATLAQQFPIPVFTIGPFHKLFKASSSSLLSQDHSCMTWLAKQASKSVIYVSFGSIVGIDKAEFLEIAWGLANSNCPFLWVIRPGLVHGFETVEPLWPDGFLEMIEGRGYIVKWAPQQDVLAHPAVGAFWTHNGWNSTLESICEGVPMLCSPNFGDQMTNASIVCDAWKVGLQLENKLEREEIKRKIRKLLVEKEGEEMRERAASLKDKTEASVIKGGSSYKALEGLIAQILSF